MPLEPLAVVHDDRNGIIRTQRADHNRVACTTHASQRKRILKIIDEDPAHHRGLTVSTAL